MVVGMGKNVGCWAWWVECDGKGGDGKCRLNNNRDMWGIKLTESRIKKIFHENCYSHKSEVESSEQV